MVDQILVGHTPIIGIPIKQVNRYTDLFSGDYSGHMKPDLSTIGNRLRYARNNKHLTQTQLAKTAKVPQSTISELETGVSATTESDKLIRLCRALEVRPAWLACYYGPEKEQLSQEALDVIGYWEALPEAARESMKNTLSKLAQIPGEGRVTAAEHQRKPSNKGKSGRD